MNITALLNQAITHAQAAQYEQLEILVRKILGKKPRHFEAMQLLGLALVQQGKADEAIKVLGKCISKEPSHIGVLVNLANAYRSKERFEEALSLSEQAINEAPGNFQSHLTRGLICLSLKSIDEAIESFTKAIQLNAGSAEAESNLGICLVQKGQLEEGINHFLKANELKPELAEVYLHLFNTLMLTHRTDDAGHVADVAIASGALSGYPLIEFLIEWAKLAWILGELDIVEACIDRTDGINSSECSLKNVFNLRAYRSCLIQLVEHRHSHPGLYDKPTENALFFIAESHCLPASQVIVSYRKKPHRILSGLITGCKAWHLASSQPNQFKASLSALLKALPEQSTIVTAVGEIDCRVDEGIFHAYIEKNIDYRISIPQLAKAYIGNVISEASIYRHTVIIYGIPAPNPIVFAGISDEDINHMLTIIALLNVSLAKECQENHLEFLDVYSLTVNEEGMSNMKYHLDTRHVKPDVMPLLFGKLSDEI